MATLVLDRAMVRQDGGAIKARVEAWLARPAAWVAMVVSVIALQLWLTLSHLPWLDEYQALQIALQSPDMARLLENLRYEGHPPLWYLLLRGAAPIASPWWTLAAVAAPMAVAIQAVILLRAPFARLDRLLIATGTFVLFEYGAVSRSLTLGVMLLLFAFAFRDRRWSWLFLALLPMADFIFGLTSLILLAIHWRERRVWAPGIALWALVSAAAAWTVRPAADVVPAIVHGGALTEAGAWLNRLSIMLLPVQTNEGRLEWNGALPLGVASIAGPLFLVLAIRLLRDNRFHLFLWSGFAAATLLFSMAVYPLAIRHLSLLALLLILLVWRAREAGEEPSALFRLWLTAASASGLLTAGLALAQPFDTAPRAAAAIRRLGLTDAHWVSFPESRGQGVSALTGIAFTKPGRDCQQTFVRWNQKGRIARPWQLALELVRITGRYGRVQLLSDIPIDAAMPAGFVRRDATVAGGYDGQAFYLYTVGSALAPTTRRPPLCVRDQRPLSLRAEHSRHRA